MFEAHYSSSTSFFPHFVLQPYSKIVLNQYRSTKFDTQIIYYGMEMSFFWKLIKIGENKKIHFK